MTNIINPNDKRYMVPTAGIKQADIQGSLEKSKQVVTENVGDNSLTKTLTGNSDPSSLALVPVLYAGDLFVNKAMGGKKGILGYAADLGDKISNIFNLDKLLSKNTGKKISDFLKTNRFTKYFTSDFKANPKLSMAQGQKMEEKYAKDLLDTLTNLKYGGASSDKLAGIHLSDKAAEIFGKIGPTKNKITPEYMKNVSDCIGEFLNQGIIDVNDTAMLKDFQESISKYITQSGNATNTTSMANNTASVLGKLKDKYLSKLPKVTAKPPISSQAMETLNSINPRQKEAIADNIADLAEELINGGVDTLQSGKKKISLSELRNKFNAANLKTGKTGLGKLFAKGTLKTKDVVTYGGGLISMFFLASSLVNTIKATKEAPEGEKKSTFMHLLSEQFLGIILFQPSINLLYKAGGNKYRGMTQEGRKALADLVKNSNSQILSNEARKIANIQKKLLIKGVDSKKVADLAGKSLKDVKTAAKSLGKEGAKLKLWERPLKFMGKILSTGLDTIKKPWVVKGKKIPHPTLKGFAGGLGRFAIIMFVLQPLLQKPITKLCHKIFGEPKTYLEKQKAEEDNKKQNAPAPKVSNEIGSDGQSTNLLKYWEEKQKQQVAATPLPKGNSSPIKPQNTAQVAAAAKLESKERYIPSVDFEFPPEDDTELNKQIDMLLKQTDKSLKNANEILKYN